MRYEIDYEATMSNNAVCKVMNSYDSEVLVYTYAYMSRLPVGGSSTSCVSSTSSTCFATTKVLQPVRNCLFEAGLQLSVAACEMACA